VKHFKADNLRYFIGGDLVTLNPTPNPAGTHNWVQRFRTQQHQKELAHWPYSISNTQVDQTDLKPSATLAAPPAGLSSAQIRSVRRRSKFG
jgi:hypothetical protein